jgi:hypothetical protein
VDPKPDRKIPKKPPVEPSGRPTPGRADRPNGDEIEELNRQTDPKGPGGQPVDPEQERDPDTAG